MDVLKMPLPHLTLRRIFSNRNVAVLTFSDILFFIGANLWWPFQPLYILAFGASKEELGILMTFSSAVMLAIQIPAGIMSDRIGRKEVILLGAVIRCITPVIFALANHWTLFFLAILINSVSNMDFPAWNALLIESLPIENRGAGHGVYRTLTSMPGIFMMPLGGFIMDSMGIIAGTRLCLVINEVMLIIYTLVLLKFLRETKSDGKERRDVHEDKERSTIVQALTSVPKPIWILALVGSLIIFATKLTMNFMVVYADEVIGITKTEWGIAGTVFSLLAASIATPSGFLADKVGRKTCILTSQVLTLISTLSFTYSRDFTWVLLSRVLGGVSSGFGGMVTGYIGGSIWLVLIADIVPREDRAKITALVATVTGAISTPSPLIGGYLYGNLSPQLPFQLNLAITAIAIVFLLFLLKEPKEKAK